MFTCHFLCPIMNTRKTVKLGSNVSKIFHIIVLAV